MMPTADDISANQFLASLSCKSTGDCREVSEWPSCELPSRRKYAQGSILGLGIQRGYSGHCHDAKDQGSDVPQGGSATSPKPALQLPLPTGSPGWAVWSMVLWDDYHPALFFGGCTGSKTEDDRGRPRRKSGESIRKKVASQDLAGVH